MPGLRAFAVGDDRDGIVLLDQVTDPFGVTGLVGDEVLATVTERAYSLTFFGRLRFFS